MISQARCDRENWAANASGIAFRPTEARRTFPVGVMISAMPTPMPVQMIPVPVHVTRPATLSVTAAVVAATRTPAPVSMTARAAIRSRKRGSTRAARRVPVPEAASIQATCDCEPPSSSRTWLTVLTTTIDPAAATTRLSAMMPRSRGVVKKVRIPDAALSHALLWVLGRASGMRVDRTSRAETRNPAEVPRNSRSKLRNVRATAASTGLSRLSMVEATWEADSARV